MKKPSLMKSGRSMLVVLSALLPLAAAQADDRDPYQGSPTYSGEERRQWQSETPGAQGPVRSDIESSQSGDLRHEDSTPYNVQKQQQQEMQGAKGPMRDEGDAQKQGYTGDQMNRSTACPSTTSEKFAPNAYYGESNPLYSAESMASFLGRGKDC